MALYSIVYFLDYGKSFGGAHTTLIQQAILMKKEGHKVVLFFSDYFGEGMTETYEAFCSNNGIEFQWETYQAASQTEDIDVVCLDENYERMRDKVASYRPDILHSMQINPSVEMISRELKIPHIMNIYPLIQDFFSIEYLNIFPHYHICDSWFYAHKWHHYLHTDSVCIRNAANRNMLKKKECKRDFLRFICVGAVYKEKNQLAVIKAFHRALNKGLSGKLTLCGYVREDYSKQCVQYIKDNKLQNHIVMKGFCWDMDVEYSQNDILICGSTRESYPNAISEAMAHGLAIISTPVAGVPEVLEDGKNGYLTRDYSVSALYEKIIQVQDDVVSGKIEKILAAAEETFIHNHSPQAVKTRLTKYYKYVVDDYKEKYLTENIDKLISIDSLRNSFRPLIEVFNKNIHCFSYPNKVALKLWYLYHIKNEIHDAITQGKAFFIWGTGQYGIVVKEMVEVFLPEVHINGFLDSEKIGSFLNYKIFYPDEVLRREDIVIFLAAVNGQDEMIEKMSEKRKVFNRDYFILSPRRW